jgi:hypothetical protein
MLSSLGREPGGGLVVFLAAFGVYLLWTDFVSPNMRGPN